MVFVVIYNIVAIITYVLDGDNLLTKSLNVAGLLVILVRRNICCGVWS